MNRGAREDWRDHPWAKGREQMLAAMTEDRRSAWLARRDDEDRIYGAWLAGLVSPKARG